MKIRVIFCHEYVCVVCGYRSSCMLECVRVYVYICVPYTCVCPGGGGGHAPVCTGEKLAKGVFLDCFLPYLLR